jgi:metal-responsive CopG/Arc/MetJ family transcriptional regulator
MSEIVKVRLNQQQLELLDDASARLGNSGRAEAIRHALREHGKEMLAQAKAEKERRR